MMHALIKDQDTKGLTLGKVKTPKISAPNEVLIKINKTAICGTDLHIYEWNEWAKSTIPIPMHIGHEFSGEIVELGELANPELSIGQRVSAEGHIACHRCRNCHAGREHICPFTKGIGVNVPGAFAEYLVMPSNNIVSLEDSISDSIGAILDPFGNALHTALCYDCTAEDVFITGAGPIGIMAAMICQFTGARNVILSDINDYRLNLAKQCGIKLVYNPQKDDIEQLKKECNIEEGFDVGLEISGNPNALNQILDHMVNGGKLAQLGIFSGPINIDMNNIVFKGITLSGIYGREMMETWYKMKALIDSGMNLNQIITHEFSYTDYQEAFELGLSGQSGKIILNWNE